MKRLSYRPAPRSRVGATTSQHAPAPASCPATPHHPDRQRRAAFLRILCSTILLSGALLGRAAADPSALWHIVHQWCVPNQSFWHNPAPCAAVNLGEGYAVLKDLRGPYQFLLIPTARVSGIDDPKILAPQAPNYWQAAWHARRILEQRVGRAVPRDDLTLAINSALGRSQNQLHIHIDCIRPDVRAALQQHLNSVGAHWAPFPVPLAGQHYRAMRIERADLRGVNPFHILARSVPAGQMRLHTLVVAAVTFGGQPGFVLLDDRADPATGDHGHGEALQDHSCMLLR